MRDVGRTCRKAFEYRAEDEAKLPEVITNRNQRAVSKKGRKTKKLKVKDEEERKECGCR